MNKSFHNIEYRRLLPFHDYRIGYDASGYVWRIYRVSDGWRAVKDRAPSGNTFQCRTLVEVSAQLEKTNAKIDR